MTKFLIDRSLGGRVLQEVLTSRGEDVERVPDIFPHDDDEGVPDPVWLRFAGTSPHVVLSKDCSMRRRASEREVICQEGLLVFCMANQQIDGFEIVRRYLNHWESILELIARTDGPAFFAVRLNEVVPRELDCN